jgi:hypothetical protein
MPSNYAPRLAYPLQARHGLLVFSVRLPDRLHRKALRALKHEPRAHGLHRRQSHHRTAQTHSATVETRLQFLDAAGLPMSLMFSTLELLSCAAITNQQNSLMLTSATTRLRTGLTPFLFSNRPYHTKTTKAIPKNSIQIFLKSSKSYKKFPKIQTPTKKNLFFMGPSPR